ncbi:hypothetical protein [Nodularia sphaerocarpa]|uniref:hypothetical protein n=1 Tax=Nodularia sphaerocarpa TaxID=137816 RepID=UPI00232CC8C3|nr:hypothetical protein [Nodularia sphaerocarpa]MDB9372370.1 hypothetical protein [Nodularia sphaerocarpa CS-585]MDB9377986.1 hypothetical protein [Nodularia sphaerocarpa CS-585A2]
MNHQLSGKSYLAPVQALIVKVKQVSEWKAALGQILTYAAFFPEHTKRIHLFGDCTPERKLIILSTVLGFDVIASFEEVCNEK